MRILSLVVIFMFNPTFTHPRWSTLSTNDLIAVIANVCFWPTVFDSNDGADGVDNVDDDDDDDDDDDEAEGRGGTSDSGPSMSWLMRVLNIMTSSGSCCCGRFADGVVAPKLSPAASMTLM